MFLIPRQNKNRAHSTIALIDNTPAGRLICYFPEGQQIELHKEVEVMFTGIKLSYWEDDKTKVDYARTRLFVREVTPEDVKLEYAGFVRTFPSNSVTSRARFDTGAHGIVTPGRVAVAESGDGEPLLPGSGWGRMHKGGRRNGILRLEGVAHYSDLKGMESLAYVKGIDKMTIHDLFKEVGE